MAGGFIVKVEPIPYYQFQGFEHVYLEDSYVLDIQINASSAEFSLSVVLTEDHPMYNAPLPGEQYCYRNGLLRFTNVERVEWLEKSMMSYTDATGAIDYSNIDELYLSDEHYYLNGDWGELKIKSSPPVLKIKDTE